MAQRLRVRKTLLVSALVVASLGCGGGSGAGGPTGGKGGSGPGGSSGGASGTGGGGPIPFSQYESLALAAGCQNEVLCGMYPDVATCLQSEQVLPHYYDTLGADIADGKIVYDATQARGCVDLWSTLPCTRTAWLKVPDDPCESVFTGTVAVGGACFFHEECASDNCQIDYSNCGRSQCCPGVCVAAPTVVGAGGDCSSPNVTCATATTCLPDASGLTSTCQPTPVVGDRCGGTAIPCQYPLYCDPTSGTCQAGVETRERCNPNANGLGCDEVADVCEPGTSVCTRLPGPGKPCDPTDGGLCLIYATCDATTGTCVALPAVGQSCNDNVGCLATNICDQTSSTCVLTPAAGACP
jgi:hypothetical protein